MTDFWWPAELEELRGTGVRMVAALSGVSLEHVRERMLRYVVYVVLEELIESRAALVASPWPEQDPDGRRMFPDRPEDAWDPDQEPEIYERFTAPYREIGVDLGAFQRFLDEHRVPGDARRPARIGDTFAISRATLALIGAALQTPEGAIPDTDPVVDVTRSARAAAKVAFSRVIAPPEEHPPDADTGPEGQRAPLPREPQPSGPAGVFRILPGDPLPVPLDAPAREAEGMSSSA